MLKKRYDSAQKHQNTGLLSDFSHKILKTQLDQSEKVRKSLSKKRGSKGENNVTKEGKALGRNCSQEEYGINMSSFTLKNPSLLTHNNSHKSTTQLSKPKLHRTGIVYF